MTGRVVIKVGGSLFDLPDLKSKLADLLVNYSNHQVCLVAGGGRSADVVRELQPIHSLTDKAAHNIALASMHVGEQLLLELVNHSAPATCSRELNEVWKSNQTAVIHAATFLAAEEPVAKLPLERNWSVTSDSIAAWIATFIGARELLLLKSLATPNESLRKSAEAGLVDAAFPRYSASIPKVKWANLRDDKIVCLPLTKDDS